MSEYVHTYDVEYVTDAADRTKLVSRYNVHSTCRQADYRLRVRLDGLILALLLPLYALLLPVPFTGFNGSPGDRFKMATSVYVLVIQH